MDTMAAVIVFGILVVFGAVIFLMISGEQKAKKRKLEQARSLNFWPVEPGQALVNRFNLLYERDRSGNVYELQNVFGKKIPDGELYVFDLVETSGDENSQTEDQAVAVRSEYLKLPAFTIFPKSDVAGAGSKIANSVMGWVLKQFGNPVDFSDHPEFAARFYVTSTDPEGTRQFLDADKLHLLANFRLVNIHAGGDMFSLSKYVYPTRNQTDESLQERVSEAMDVFQIFSR